MEPGVALCDFLSPRERPASLPLVNLVMGSASRAPGKWAGPGRRRSFTGDKLFSHRCCCWELTSLLFSPFSSTLVMFSSCLDDAFLSPVNSPICYFNFACAGSGRPQSVSSFPLGPLFLLSVCLPHVSRDLPLTRNLCDCYTALSQWRFEQIFGAGSQMRDAMSQEMSINLNAVGEAHLMEVIR